MSHLQPQQQPGHNLLLLCSHSDNMQNNCFYGSKMKGREDVFVIAHKFNDCF